MPPSSAPNPASASQPVVAEPSPATLRYAATLPIDVVDPLTGLWNEASSLVFSRPLAVDAFGVLRGDLVSEWTVTDGGRTWRLTPRAGVNWHDGKPFVAADLEHSLELLADPANAGVMKPSLAAISSIESVAGPQGTDVIVSLTDAVPGFAELLARACVVPSHHLDAAALRAGGLTDEPIGTGPYRLTDRGDGWASFDAHTAYHHGGASISRIEMRHVADDERRAGAMARGEFDIAQVKPQQLGHLADLDGVGVQTIATRVWRAFTFSLSHPQLAKPAVRRALSALIDRDEVVADALGGYGRPQYWPMPPSSWASPPEPPPLGADVAESTLLAAGWRRGDDGRWTADGSPVGLRLCYLETETFRAAATCVITRQFDDFGITVTTEPITWEQYHSMDRVGLRGSGYDGIVVGWSGGVDPYDNLAIRYSSTGAYNRDGYADDELDALLRRAGLASDQNEARQLYHQIAAITHRDSIMAPLANPHYLFATRTGLTGFEQFEVDSFYEFPQYAHLLRWTE